jgi:hypothetical protein
MTDNQGYGTVYDTEYTYDQFTDDAPVDIATREANPWPSQPLPVVSATQEEAPQYGSCMTWNVPQVGIGQPIQILQRRLRRNEARLYLNSVAAILTTITAPAVPASGVAQYNNTGQPVTVTVSGGTVTVIAVNGVTTGLTSGPIIVPANGNIAITYSVLPTWIWQTSGPGAIIVNSKLDPLQGASPQGATYSNLGQFLTWESQQPVYAIALGGVAIVSVLDEAYAER